MSNDSTQENPLHKRLGIRVGLPGAVIAAPEDADNPLLPLPEKVVAVASVDDLPEQDGQLDYIHYFARSRAELTRVLPQLRERLAPHGSLWISWIKQSAVHRGGGLPGDLNENVIRRMALASGLVDVKVAALDQDWSALRLVFRKH
jgi:hypothetical protein